MEYILNYLDIFFEKLNWLYLGMGILFSILFIRELIYFWRLNNLQNFDKKELGVYGDFVTNPDYLPGCLSNFKREKYDSTVLNLTTVLVVLASHFFKQEFLFIFNLFLYLLSLGVIIYFIAFFYVQISCFFVFFRKNWVSPRKRFKKIMIKLIKEQVKEDKLKGE